MPGGWIPAAYQVDPKGVFHLWRELMRFDGESYRLSGVCHRLERSGNPSGDYRILDEGVRRNNMDSFVPLLVGKFGKSGPHQLQDGGRVLTPAIANDPGGVIGQIERFDFLDEDGDCLAKALFAKGRLFAQLTFSGIR